MTWTESCKSDAQPLDQLRLEWRGVQRSRAGIVIGAGGPHLRSRTINVSRLMSDHRAFDTCHIAAQIRGTFRHRHTVDPACTKHRRLKPPHSSVLCRHFLHRAVLHYCGEWECGPRPIVVDHLSQVNPASADLPTARSKPRRSCHADVADRALMCPPAQQHGAPLQFAWCDAPSDQSCGHRRWLASPVGGSWADGRCPRSVGSADPAIDAPRAPGRFAITVSNISPPHP